MKAVVLVGGEGTRMRPLTYDTPKPLLPIANRSFLDRQLDWLAAHGVDEVVLSLGYLPDAFAAHFAEHPAPVAVRFAVEDEPLGTAGAIRFASEGIAEPFVVCNGDVLTALDLGALVRFHREHGSEATIHLTEVDDPSSFGVVPTRSDGEVVAFVEKPSSPRTAPSRWINAGTYVLDPSVLDRIPPRLMVSVERETFPRMLDERRRLYAMRTDAYWIDIGSPEHYVRAHLDVLDGVLGPVAPGARELAPGVWAQGEVEVAPSATLDPPVLLGPGAVVGDGARVQRSSLGAGACVGNEARVLRSVLHRAVTVDEQAEVADSVLGTAARVGKDARVGARTVVGAGVVIAPHARVANAKLQVG